jgi:hypothetical protein
LHDGVSNIGRALADLIDERPKKTDGSGFESLPGEVEAYLRGLDWVEDAEVRLREDGHVFFGEAFVRVRRAENLIGNIERAVQDAREIDWRLHELVIMPVARLPSKPAGDQTSSAAPPAEQQRGRATVRDRTLPRLHPDRWR